MPWSFDARVPVLLRSGGHLAGAAALVEAGRPAPEGAAAWAAVELREEAPSPHPSACPCCAGRAPAALALDRLFQARARGEAPWFDRVVVTGGEGLRAAVEAALRDDALCAARYRAG